jgi:hypothetical protein
VKSVLSVRRGSLEELAAVLALLDEADAWPEHGIEETVTELDSNAIREAAQRATPLWPST